VFDLGFSFIVISFGFPLFFILGLITLISSKGSIIYKSERIGQYGRVFNIYKFRSMVVDADEIAMAILGGDFHSKGENDPRITKWGMFLRKTRLDELPQFWNVILGEMSIIGPRPLPYYDVQMLIDASEEKHQLILQIKPGLTSLGQIRVGYARNKQENVKRMYLDLLYHRNFNLLNDIWLIFKTVGLMIQAKGL
jgi:lipopolysaccharide/colanic/teichoic acid biosynthesis glycosyltransferase